MADWVDVGILLADGYGEQPRPNVLRTSMDSGPPKQLRVHDATLRVRPVSYRFKAAEYTQFEDWYRDMIDSGAGTFNWTDPRDNVSKLARIVDGAYSAAPDDSALLSWTVSFELETFS